MRVRFTIYNEEVENTVNDRLKKKLLCFERALSTLEGYEGWMIGTTTLHMDWQPKQGENEFCHTKLTPEIIKKGRSAIRVRIAAAEEEKERENEEMEVLLVKPRQSVLAPEKEKMPLMKAITELGSEDDDTLAFSRSQMEEYLREAADTNPIHQGEAAVLPGFLVMNACLLRLWKKGWMKGQTALEVRFLAPLRPDEEVYLSDSGQEGRNAVYLRTKQEGKEILSITEK